MWTTYTCDVYFFDFNVLVQSKDFDVISMLLSRQNNNGLNDLAGYLDMK